MLTFYNAAQTVWNSFPSTYRLSQTLNTFLNILKPIFTSLLLIVPSDLSSASDSFYWMIMALSQILLLTYVLTYLHAAAADDDDDDDDVCCRQRKVDAWSWS